MAKVLAPNRQFTGVSASVNFVNGEGETGNAHLIGWFSDHGYTVEDAPKAAKGPGKKAAKADEHTDTPSGEAGDADDAGKTEAPTGDPQ